MHPATLTVADPGTLFQNTKSTQQPPSSTSSVSHSFDTDRVLEGGPSLLDKLAHPLETAALSGPSTYISCFKMRTRLRVMQHM
jgi:hypothetical protein